MPANTQEYDDHHNIQTIQQNSLAIAIKDKNKIQYKMEELVKQLFRNYSNLITYFHTTKNYWKI